MSRRSRLTTITIILAALVVLGFVGIWLYPETAKDEGETEAAVAGMKADEWEKQGGNWEFGEDRLLQSGDGEGNRIYFKEPIVQDQVQLSVEIKLLSDAASGGVEFRSYMDADRHSKSAFMLNLEQSKANVYLQQSSYNSKFGQRYQLEKDVWYKVRIELNGSNGKFFINDEQVEERTDMPMQADRLYVALVADHSGAVFRNFSFANEQPEKLAWLELIKMSNIVKKGYDRYHYGKFEYPYIGLGKTTVYAGPDGFLRPDAPKPTLGVRADTYRYEPMLVYDYWWDGTEKVDPFIFQGGYQVGDRVLSGELEDVAEHHYFQEVDVSNGMLTTMLTMDVDGELVTTTRQMFVNEDGVVVMKVISDSKHNFVFQIAPRNNSFEGGYELLDNGLLAKSTLRFDHENSAYVSVVAESDAPMLVDAEKGTITVQAATEPIYFYLSPASDLNEKNMAGENAIGRANAALDRGFDQELAAISAWWDAFYAKSEIAIPDLGMAKWYVRSLYYHAVSMAGARIPPGTYSTNPEGFFGNVCFEFDLMFSQLAMLNLNHSELSQSTIDWIYGIKDRARELAESEQYGDVDGGYLFAWLMAYDGTPIQNPGLKQGWKTLYPGANLALAVLNQALWNEGDLGIAQDILTGQLRMLLSLFQSFPDFNGGLAHAGVWGPSEGDFSKHHPGDFLQNVAAIWSIRKAQELGVSTPEWDAMLDELLLYKVDENGLRTSMVYDPSLGQYVYVNNVLTDESTNPKGAGGPQNAPYYWLNIFDLDDPTTMPTLINIIEGGNLDYNFNKGWTANLAARLGQADLATWLTGLMLDAGSTLYDDSYMVENKHDEEDFERGPALGAHGAYLLALSSLLFNGDSDQTIIVFPAIKEAWQRAGVSFSNFAANGNIEVSAEYTDDETKVTLRNNAAKSLTRSLLVRVREGSAHAEADHEYYELKDGSFAQIEVALAPGEERTIRVKGVAAKAEIKPFASRFPVADAEGIRPSNAVFGWNRSDNASNYRLIVSAHADLSDPVYDRYVGNRTLYYPLAGEESIDLDAETTYYWNVYAGSGENEAAMLGGTQAFRTGIDSD